MRDTVAGSVLAIVFLALLFAAPQLLPRGIEGTTRAEIAQISKGFRGTRFIASWVLVCSKPAAPAGRSASAASQSTQAVVGPCRMARGYRDNNGRLILTVAFRYAGPGRGHVGVVSAVTSAREIRLDHANWLGDGAIYIDDPVVDVSEENNWSEVRVWNPRTDAWGRKTYLVQGFIGPDRIFGSDRIAAE
jgi:hypothetical protein